MNRLSFAALVAVGAFLLLADVPEADAAGASLRTDGWCTTASTTAASAWTSAPARITDVIKAKVRSIEVTHGDEDETDSAIDVCTKLGPSTSDGLTCNGDTGTAGVLYAQGQGRAFPIARDFSDGTVPPVWFMSASGTPRVCFDISY
jgi:hypothetical protein